MELHCLVFSILINMIITVKKTLLYGGGGLAFITVLYILTIIDPEKSVWMPKCLFRLLTGLQCPGCGGLRAMHALLHGDVVRALRYNWFIIYAISYLLLLIFERFFLKGDWQQKIRHFAENTYLVMFFALSCFVWFVVRNCLNI